MLDGAPPSALSADVRLRFPHVQRGAPDRPPTLLGGGPMRGVRPRSSAHDTKRTTSGTNRPPARLRQRYRCVMIPPHEEESGNLPPGLHLATWGEVASRFGGSERRLDLLAGLKQALLSLRSAGCRQAYLDGSFVTTKEAPGDFDACWEASGVDASRLDSACSRSRIVGPRRSRSSAGSSSPPSPLPLRTGRGFSTFSAIPEPAKPRASSRSN